MVGVADSLLIARVDDKIESFERDEADQYGAQLSATSATRTSQSRPWIVNFTELSIPRGAIPATVRA